MIKKNVLKGKITENETTYTKCGEAIGVTKATFTNKINNHTSFSIHEAKQLADFLNLSTEETCNIFLR
ncbi:helix-turn-helix domain-containing protein [Clostridium sp.]